MPPDRASSVADVLELLALPGGPHHVDAPAASWRLDDGASLTRPRFQRTVVDGVLNLHRRGAENSGSLVITAGVPGAGKSSAVTSILSTSTSSWLRVDPDDIKTMLISEGVRAGRFTTLLARDLPDGGRVMPLELSGLVHRESTQIASDLTQAAMAEHLAVVIEGTLSWPGQIGEYIENIRRFAYRQIQVLVAEVEEAVAQERALARWWQGRWSGDDLGGRFIPAAVIHGCYDRPGLPSRCLTNAQELVRRINALTDANASLQIV